MTKPTAQYVLKRAMDLVLSLLGLFLLSPVFLATAVVVALFLGCPVLFRQVRPGLNGTPFTMYKFRTMRNAYGPNGALLSDEQRLTRFGRFLRSSSLDELPELFNVLRGDMSLVGPRPLLMEYLNRYTPHQARRHEVMPGITGWAQINGRNALGWEARFDLDVWYVDNWSLWLDINILRLTVWKILQREGINTPGHPTAPAFMGSHDEGATK